MRWHIKHLQIITGFMFTALAHIFVIHTAADVPTIFAVFIIKLIEKMSAYRLQ